MFYNQKFLRKILSKILFLVILLGTIFAKGHPLGGDYANDVWIHILAATWQVTNQSASKQSAGLPW
jgi:uncharacterized protein (UPF0333 family)